jgi:hypothetical protein
MENKSKNWIVLGLLGLGAYIFWKSKSKPSAAPDFKDKELEKLVNDIKKIPDVKVESGVPVVEGGASWIDTRPTYDMVCFPKNWKDALSMPECKGYFHVANAQKIENGLIKIPQVTSLTKDEFESMGNLDLLMVQGQIMPKGYYVDYILKPDPKLIAEEVQRQLDIQEQLKIPPPEPILMPVQGGSDPLKPVASQEYISKYDPDNVLARRRMGIDVGYTGVRQPQVTVSTSGNPYSGTRMVDGVMMGYPIEGAIVTDTIVANDGIGTVLYQNKYIMKSGVLTPID